MNPWQDILKFAGLQADFEIIDIKQFRKLKKLEFYLNRTDDSGSCYQCGQRSSCIHSKDKIRLKDLSCFEYEVELIFDRYTLYCSKCRGYRVENFWLLRKGKGFTWRYEKHISRLCEETTNAAVGRLERLNDKTVYNIDFELLNLRLTHQPPPEDLGPDYSMDEIHWRTKKGKHPKFITNLVDLTHRKVVTNAPGRDQESARNCLLWLSKEQREEMKSIAVDLHDSYIAAVKQECKKALIVLDRFHVMKLFNESMNEFRKDQLKLATDSDEIQLLKGRNKWILLSRPENLSKTGKILLEELKGLNERVLEALLIKEQLVAFFDEQDSKEAKKQWIKFHELVVQADIKCGS